jgi:antitoxin HicB
MSIYSIRLYLEPNPGGVYTVTSPDVPGLVTEGRTPQEIQINVQEVLNALMEAWANLGKTPPPALRKNLR